MAEQVYGLTEASAKVLAAMADKHRQRLPDAGRRTRRVDDEKSPQIRLVYITEDATGSTGGARHWFAIDPRTAVVTCNTLQDGTGDEIEVAIKEVFGVFFTGQRVQVVRVHDPEANALAWRMLSPGQDRWLLATASGDIVTTGDATLTYDAAYPTDAQVTIDVPVTAWDSSINYTDGETIVVEYEPITGVFYARDSACP